jgi:hypothetical protein
MTSPTSRQLPDTSTVSAPEEAQTGIEISQFLDKVYRLSREDEHKAVDAVYNFMDDLLLAGRFSACDETLKRAAPENFTLAVAISFLIVTRRANSKLPERDAFFTRAEAVFVEGREAAEIKSALRNYR